MRRRMTASRTSSCAGRWSSSSASSSPMTRLCLTGAGARGGLPSRAKHAQEALGARATILCQDLVELELPEPVDTAFSNATFHWVHDHDRLFARLYATIKPGGQLVAQCGGRGNIDSFRVLADEIAASDEFKRYFTDWQRPWNYAGAEETAERLRN